MNDQPTDIVDLMQSYIDEGKGSPSEQALIGRALQEIRNLRSLHGDPVEGILLRNQALALENRNLRKENTWHRTLTEVSEGKSDPFMEHRIAEEILSSEAFAWLVVGSDHPHIHRDAIFPAWKAWQQSRGRKWFQ